MVEEPPLLDKGTVAHTELFEYVLGRA